MKRNFDANQRKSLRVKDFINDKDKLWNYCLYWAMHKENFNFAEVSLKSIKQKDIYDVDKLDYGLCGLTAMYSSFNEFLQLSMDDINNIVEKMGKNIRSIGKLSNYINSNYCKNLLVKIEAERFKNNRSLKEKIEENLTKNKSPVFWLIEDITNSGHAVSVYKLTDGILGFIENGEGNILVSAVAAFCIYETLEKIKSPDINSSIQEIYKKHNDLFQEFYRKYVKFLDDSKVEFHIGLIPDGEKISKGLAYLVSNTEDIDFSTKPLKFYMEIKEKLEKLNLADTENHLVGNYPKWLAEL